MSSTHREHSERSLTIIELCLSPGRGGLEHYAAGLVPDLSARGHRLLVVARDGNDFSTRTGCQPALTLKPHRYLPWIGARRLCALIKASGADVIHIHRSADLALAVMAKRCAAERPALLYTRHMLITRDRRRSWPHRFMFKHVDKLLTITEQIAAAADRYLPMRRQHIQALPPGVGPADHVMHCSAIRPPDTDFVIGCFSRVERGKGQHELIEAIAGLREQGIRAGGVFAGAVMNDAYARRIRRRVEELGLTGAIRFLGTLRDARPAMPCCDVVVLPSEREPLGLVLVEAMLMKVPVVATAAGGVLELIDDEKTGLMYPVADIQALTRQLQRLATRPEFAQRLALAGHYSATRRFDRNTHLDRLEAVLHKLAAERSHAAVRR